MTNPHRVVISGASSELGKVLVRHYQGDGADVVALTRDADRLHRALQTAGLATDRITIAAADLGDLEQTTAAIGAAMSGTDGRVSTVINAVGRFVAGPLDGCAQPDFEAVFRVNVQAVFSVCRASLPYLRRAGRGSIVNVASILGHSTIDGVACAAYGAAKAALIQYTRMLAVELAPHAIRVNCVCPGVLQPTAERMDPRDLDRLKAFKRLLDRQPIKQFGTPQQIADAITFLAGARSGWTTGSILTVDGGMAVA